MKNLITASPEAVLNTPPEVYDEVLTRHRVEVEVLGSAQNVYILFKNSPADQNENFPITQNFPLVGKGNYIIRKSRITGKTDQVKIFFMNKKDSFLRFTFDDARPDASPQISLELVLLGTRLIKNFPVPVTPDDILFRPFSQIMESLDYIIPWNRLLPDITRINRDLVLQMINKIRPFLKNIREAYDSGMDQFGNPVYIRDISLKQDEKVGFNCSGFVKWIADGSYRFLSRDGLFLPINLLKKKSLTERGEKNPWSKTREDRDPYFGLDWTRNIVREISSKIYKTDVPLKKYDVRNLSFFTYLDNVGYPVRDLKSVLYLMAVQYPGSYFLGAVSSEYGKNPVLRQYHHIATFIPYFTEEGEFKVSVMDIGVEQKPQTFINRFPDSYIHFSRLEVPELFRPPAIPRKSGSTPRG